METPKEGRGGPRLQQQRLSLFGYLLHQVRSSRDAYLSGEANQAGSDGHSWNASCGDSVPESVDLGAGLGATNADGLSSALSYSVRVADLLDALKETNGGKSANDTSDPRNVSVPSATASATWGTLALKRGSNRDAADGLELYLCERLLPILDSGIVAMCKFYEKLQADELQYAQKQAQREVHEGQGQQSNNIDDRGEGCLLLGSGLHRRFDPLVWLGQFLLRHGKAAQVYTEAEKSSGLVNDPAGGKTTEDVLSQVRGEHLSVGNLPLYAAVASQVQEERGWRALEALRPNVEVLFEGIKSGQDGFAVGAGDFPTVLQAIDAAWGLSGAHSLSAAVFAVDSDSFRSSVLSEASSMNSPDRGVAADPAIRAALSQHNQTSSAIATEQRTPQSSLIRESVEGECSHVQLEVADANNILFHEVWQFVVRCLEVSENLRKTVFSYARSG